MKYLPVCLVFLLLIFCGGLASRVLFPPSMEKNLAKQSTRILKSAGIDADSGHIDHYFVSLAGQAPVANGTPIVVKHLGGQVWGATIDSDTFSAYVRGPQSSVKAQVRKNGLIALSGEVHSARFKKLMEDAASNAIGTRRVENQITVNEELGAPSWEEEGPAFLKHFLSFSGVSEFAADIDGISLDGEVLSREVREKLGDHANRLVSAPAVLQNKLSVRAPRNATFRLKGSSGGIKLTGLLPNEATRRNLIAAVRQSLPDRELTDELKIAAGVAKPWWLPNAEKLIPVFLKETEGLGSIEYWKNRVHLSGSVSDDSFEDKLASMPLGPEKPEDFSMDSDLTLRPTKEPELSVFTNQFGKLVAKGTVGNSAFKDQVLGALVKEHPDAVVIDQIVVDAEVKDLGWGNPAPLIDEVIFKTENGAIEMQSLSVAIKGKVDSQTRKDILGGFAAAVSGPEGTIENALEIPEEPVEKPASAGELLPEPEVDFKKVAVYFDSGSSRVSSRYYDEVEQAANLIKTLNLDTKLIVGGYADNRGNRAANERLGKKRATAVRDRLIKLGIDKSRLEIKTFGEDVSNVSYRNLWKSRRVELSINRE